jgi:23S rRNA pseudouridine2605 synthase
MTKHNAVTNMMMSLLRKKNLTMNERIQKLLSLTGVASRREAERWIADGRVTVNGERAKLGDRAGRNDDIRVDGRAVSVEEAGVNTRVIAYNKPVGEVCTRDDPEGRPTVFDHLPKTKNERWINVGRLDINTSGLLLFTTDGELANKLMHPSSGVDREYAVRVRGDVDQDMINRLKEGVLLEDGMASFTDVRYFDGEGQNKWYHVVLMEGRNREVRRLWESQEITVSRLKRVRYGCIFMPANVPVGTWVELGQKEVNDLYDLVDLRRRTVKKFVGKEKEQYLRQMRRQKVRQTASRRKR